MKNFRYVLLLLISFAAPAFATVTVTSPTPGSTVTSPVQYTATATSSTCSKGVGSMGIYVNNKQVYSSGGKAQINTQLSLSAGAQHTVVEEWDKCGGSTYTTVNITVTASNPAPTVTLTANPTSIASGSSSVLTATATNATGVTVTGSDGKTYTLAANGGMQSVSPAATTTYTATATGTGGTTASATTTVTVTANPAPTVAIGANPTSIASGSSSVLTVTATNATGVVVSGSDGKTYTLAANGGTQSVTPSATTTYTATATGTGGTTASATTTVTVTANPAPTVAISANPTSVTSGSSSILTVTATNATGVTVTGSDNSKYTLQASGGMVSVSPTSSTTYTATATATGGATASASTTLTVTPNPAPTVIISANPASITTGNSSTLTVSSTNATQVVITGSDNSSYTLPTPNGTYSVSPTATTTYTATATGAGGTTAASTTVTVLTNPTPTVNITANPTSITSGNSSTLTVTATNAASVTVTGTDGNTYDLQPSGGTQIVSPTATTTYTATADGNGNAGNVSASTTVEVGSGGSIKSINHVIFMLQENHSFDSYFGMLNPYRVLQGWTTGDDGNVYNVDGIDDKLATISNKDDEGTYYNLFKFKTTCIDDDSSAWLASYGDVNRYDFLATRPILMDGFVHNAEGFAKACVKSGTCSGSYTDTTGQRAMGYYDQGLLNYYYYMASQFAVSDRWFSPASSKSVTNRIATFTGGTTQGLVEDPGSDDHLGSLNIATIFSELDAAKVSWKIYYTSTDGYCLAGGNCSKGGSTGDYPATYFTHFSYAYQYLHGNTTGTCTAPTVPSSAVGDTTNSFCIDPAHIAPLTTYYTDLTNGTLPSFAFIEAGSGINDEHPGSGSSILLGQTEVAKVVNAFMASPEWKDSVFFFSYDEGGGPYDHVPPVPGHSNDYTNTSTLGTTPPDITSIAVNADSYNPCVPVTPGTPTLHCDLATSDPGANSTDAAAEQGFAAQLGFRLPNFVISPFTRRHYVSHIPMDHTAVIKFVENRFIGSSAHLTARDNAQPDLLDFFDFNGVPWATPPTPPTPANPSGTCTPASM